MPYVDNALPSRAKLRHERDEPNEMKSRTEQLEPR
jgi:hypothetical protein